jgi:hypothetical protein
MRRTWWCSAAAAISSEEAEISTTPRTVRIVLRILNSLNQARCCEAEAPRFMRLVLGDTLGDANHCPRSDHEAASGFADQTAVSTEKHRMATGTVVA